ncbi:MAG: DUF58 domain-containing protein [Bryobacteraceae bacterium]|nr:DUF58 domain-containing protein [Bryobacteraceae bacterium]
MDRLQRPCCRRSSRARRWPRKPVAEEFQIEREFLEKLERLTIHWRKSFPGLVGGHNASRFAGPGQEFLDHRNFHHGDDLRAVNWRAYLRLDKMFLKMFQVEPRVPVRMLLDASASMTVGEGAQRKFNYARRLAAAMCYVALVRLDMMTIQPFREKLSDAFACGGGRHRFAPAADYLKSLQCAGTTSFLEVSRQFIAEYPQRGLVIVISDFLSDEDCLKPLQYLADFGHELLLMQVWTEEDRTPPWSGELMLTDAESGTQKEISFDEEARRAYTAAFDEHAKSIERLALRNGGRYVGLSTRVAIEDAVFQATQLNPAALRAS